MPTNSTVSLRLRRSPWPCCRSRATNVLAVALVAIAAAVTPAAAQNTGFAGVLPISAPFSGGGSFSSPLLAPVTPTDCSAPQYSFQGDANTGIGYTAADNFSACANGAAVVTWNTGGVRVVNGGTLGFSAGAYTATDVVIARENANDIGIRNGASAQSLRVYNTYTDAANYERLNLLWTASEARIHTVAAGTGVVRDLSIGTGTNAKWVITGAAGHLTASTDNTLDIGASLATRPRSIYWGTALIGPGTVATTGTIRLANSASLMWANSGASTVGTRLTGSDIITWDAGAAFPLGYQMFTAASTGLTVSAGGIVNSSNAFTVGTTVASAGALRLPNNTAINWRNAGNSADLGWTLNASDSLIFTAHVLPSSDDGLDLGGAANRVRGGYFGSNGVRASAAAITVGAGTGITVNTTGQLQRQVYKVTIDRTAFICAATTCDVTIATLPAKTAILGAYGELTTTFACTATCTTATLSMTLGSGAGGTQFLVSFDADAATAVFGDADAELGTALARASTIQAGNIYWSGTTASVRLTSGTGNIGTGAATNLSQGSVTFYLVTERLP